MSTYDLEEQERIAALKDWWDKWGKVVIAAAVAAVLGMVGTFFYRDYQKTQGEKAEALFADAQKAGQDSKKLTEAATALAEKYPDSFFATEAKLMAARSAVDGKDLAAAETHLRWVIDHGRDLYRNVARLRLAAIMLETKKYDDALKLLGDVKEEGFASVTADLKGDVYAAQGRADEARAAYQVAVDKSETRSALKSISQAKLDALGGALVTKKDEPAKTDAKPDDKSGEKK